MMVNCFGAEGLIAAVILDLIFGDPHSLPHPVRWMGSLISKMEGILYPSGRKFQAWELKVRGLLLVICVVTTSGLTCWGILWLTVFLFPPAVYIIAIWIAYSTIAMKSLYVETHRVIQAIGEGNIEKARQSLSFIVSRDTENLGEAEILASVLETFSENISDGVVAPLFYLALGGPVLAVIYKALNTLDSMIGYKNERYLHFGQFAARLDDLANFVPSRVTGWLIVLSAWVLKLDWRETLRIMRRDCRKVASPNAGYPQAAMAGALGVRLGGCYSYFGRPVQKPFMGIGRKRIEVTDYHRALQVYAVVCFLSVLFAVVIRFFICRMA